MNFKLEIWRQFESGEDGAFEKFEVTGIDPEAGYFTALSGNQNDFQTAPPSSYFTFRLNLTF